MSDHAQVQFISLANPKSLINGINPGFTVAAVIAPYLQRTSVHTFLLVFIQYEENE